MSTSSLFSPRAFTSTFATLLLMGCVAAEDDAESNGVDLSVKTITFTVAKASGDGACPFETLTTTRGGAEAGVSLGFEPDLPLIEVGYNKEEGAVSARELINFRFDVRPDKTSRESVSLVPPEDALTQEGGYAYAFFGFPTEQGVLTEPDVVTSTHNIQLTSGKLELERFDPDDGFLRGSFEGTASCMPVGEDPIEIAVTGTITIE